jgi:Flp pilus assembly protein TadG
MSLFRPFRRDQRGNVAVMFALSLVPLVGMAGAAIDYSRVSQVHTKLADALDAAVLAVGSQPPMTDAKLYATVQSWMQVHMDTTIATSWKLDSVTQDKGNIVGIASADVDMTISRILGINSVPVTVQSQALRSLGKIELALVLDNTGSMKGTKIDTLKSAASKLVDSLAEATTDSNDLKVGLVPFSQTVNVGPDYQTANWLDAAGKSDAAKSLFMGLQVNRFDLFKAMGTTWSGCVETRDDAYEAAGTAPSAGQPDTLYVPYFAPDEPGAKGAKGYSEYNNSYLDDSADKDITKEFGLGRKANRSSDWYKYVQGDVLKYAGANPYSGTTGTFGYAYGPNSGCEIAPLMRLSSDTSAVKGAINAMIANGNTDIPAGLAWGWNVLAPDGPFGNGVPYRTDDWTKIVVLMTDGNNENAEGNQSDESYYSGVGYIWQGRMGATSANKSKRTDLRDAELGAMCTNMKAKGIVIYTVRVEVKNGSSSVLQDCASDPDKFYDVQNVGDLVATFDDIGGKIQKLRLAR